LRLWLSALAAAVFLAAPALAGPPDPIGPPTSPLLSGPGPDWPAASPGALPGIPAVPVMVDGFALTFSAPGPAPVTRPLALGGLYGADLNGVSFELGGLYLRDQGGGDDWRLGAALAWQGLRVGLNLDGHDAEDPAMVGVGLSWDVGSWSLAGGWATSIDGSQGADLGVWASYALRPGVTGTLSWATNAERPADSADMTLLGYLRIGF
jgi:hypothetical protein